MAPHTATTPCWRQTDLSGQRVREAVRKTVDWTLQFSLLCRTDLTRASLSMGKRFPGLTAVFKNAFKAAALFSPPRTPAFRQTKPHFQHWLIVTSLQVIRCDTDTERYPTSILKSTWAFKPHCCFDSFTALNNNKNPDKKFFTSLSC